MMLSSFQEYMINITRSKRDWEAELSNISYEQALEIEKDKNVKEISFSQKIGISEEKFSKNASMGIKIKLYVYDKTAVKNCKIRLTKGRYPENDKEVIINLPVISSGWMDSYIGPTQPGEKLEVTIGGKKQEYTVVGIAEELNDLNEYEFGKPAKVFAMTLLDEKKLNKNDTVTASILTKNIKEIYETTEKYINKYNIKKPEKEEISEEEMMEQIRLEFEKMLKGEQIEDPIENDERVADFEYNTELLNYAGVLQEGSEFQKKLQLIELAVILFVTLISIIVIYTAFKMAYSERVKEFGMLSSIGMNRKQKLKIALIEASVLGAFGIIIGIIMGAILSGVILHFIDILMKNMIDPFGNRLIREGVKLYVKIPFNQILVVIGAAYIIVFVSSLLPMRKINKMNIIDSIRNKANTKIKRKEVKSPKVIAKLFNTEGVLAYKNIRREKSRYKTIVVSLTISIILFLSVNGFINNLYYNQNKELSVNYTAYTFGNGWKKEEITSKQALNEIVEKIKEEKILNSYFMLKRHAETQMTLTKDKRSEALNQMIEDGIYKEIMNLAYTTFNPDGTAKTEQEEFYIKVITFEYMGEAYEEILKKAGIKELKDNETIIVNTINEKTKYGDKLEVTNLKVGDTYMARALWDQERQMSYKVVGIVDNFEPYTIGNPDFELGEDLYIYQMVNPATAQKEREQNNIADDETYLAIKTDNPYRVDEIVEEIDEKYKDNNGTNFRTIYGNNVYANRLSIVSKQKIVKIIAYTIILLTIAISTINIYNTISSAIYLRKRDFAELRSIGMSSKQVKKMMRLEGIFYGLDAVIYGTLISILVLFIMHVLMFDMRAYAFIIPWKEILGTTIVTYIIIFISMWGSMKRIKKLNIIDEIRNENI